MLWQLYNFSNHDGLPLFSVGAGDEEAIEEGDEDMTDQEFDEIFLGKKLGDLSDEEAAEEVRWVHAGGVVSQMD